MLSSDLKLRQLDEVLLPLAGGALPVPPRHGWLKAIREALGITTRQFGRRVGLANSTIVQAEQGEAAGTISLGQLRRLADALDCEMHYMLVPRGSLATRVDQQADRKARERVAPLAHSMALEQQRAGSTFEELQVTAVKDELLRGRRSRLWD